MQSLRSATSTRHIERAVTTAGMMLDEMGEIIKELKAKLVDHEGYTPNMKDCEDIEEAQV